MEGGGVLDSGDSTAYLDYITTPLRVWSLRRAISTYSGYCARVMRASDQAILDVGFVSNMIDTAAILTFIGTGDAYIKTLYDQMGGGSNFDLTNVAAYTTQPWIAKAGSILVNEFGCPMMVFDGLTTNSIPLKTASNVALSNCSLFMSAKFITQVSNDLPFSVGTAGQTRAVRALYRSATSLGFATWGNDIASSALSTDMGNSHIFGAMQSGRSITLRRDSVSASATLGADPLTTAGPVVLGSIFGGGSAYVTNIGISEAIMWNSSISAVVTEVTDNIKFAFGTP